MPDVHFPRTPGLLGPIFGEAGRGDRGIHEALFLTFNVDLGFFEDRLLSVVRRAGAAVTVVADASVFDPDPRSVQSAGRLYALGLAHHHAAFHPKLSVLAGPDRAVIGIGSGNLTVGGWHSNDEVLTTITADADEGAPRIIVDIVSFLRRLSRSILMAPLACEGIERTANMLEVLLGRTATVDTGHRLVDSLETPIIDQLSDEPVHTLETSSPFYDERGAALGALAARCAARRVVVFAQSGQAVMDPAALRRGARVPVQFVDADTLNNRYRHGKIATAVRSDGTTAWNLTGSPNLTSRALLRSATTGGNVELGVVSDAPSLLPSPVHPVPDPAPLVLARTERGVGTASALTSVRILEARMVDTGLMVLLTRTTDLDIDVEVSLFAAPPDTYDLLGTIPAGMDRFTFNRPVDAVSRIRINGYTQFVADPDSVRLRFGPAGNTSGSGNPTRAALFSDPALAAQFGRAMSELLQSYQPSAVVRGTTSPLAREGAASTIAWPTLDDDDTMWERYAESARDALGLPLFALATGTSATPRAAAVQQVAGPALGWADMFDDTPDSFEDDDRTAEAAEDLDDSLLTRSDADRSTELTGHQAAFYRRWLGDLNGLMPSAGPVERIALAQLVIAGTASRCWNAAAGERGWFHVLESALQHLTSADWPERLVERAAAVAAIGVYRLQAATPPDGRGTEAVAVQTIVSRCGALLDRANPDVIASLLDLLHGTRVPAVSTTEIVDELRALMSTDVDAALLSRLARAEDTLDVTWAAPRQLAVQATTSNPMQVAARVVDLADDHPAIAVAVNAPAGRWALMVSAPTQVMLVEKRGTTVHFTTHTVRRTTRRAALAADSGMRQRTRVSRAPFASPGHAELALVADLPVDALPLPEAVRDALAGRAPGR